jgi:hypothetical protein
MYHGLAIIAPLSVDKTGGSSTASFTPNGSVTFAACTSLSLNNVFSAAYTDYQIVIRHNGTQTSESLNMRLRRAFVDDATANNYKTQYLFASGGNPGGTRYSLDNWNVAGASSNYRDGAVINLYAPFETRSTAYRTVGVYGWNSVAILDYAGMHIGSNSFTGFTLYPQTGNTFSGRVAVYGLRK